MCTCKTIYNNNIQSEIPQVESEEGGAYAALPLRCEGREEQLQISKKRN